MSIVENFFSWQFVIGVMVGFVMNRSYHLGRVCWLEHTRPLPNGRHRSRWQALTVDPRYLAGAIGITVAAWSIFQSSANAEQASRLTIDAKQFASDTRECQKQLITAITANRAVTAEYNEQSALQRDALSTWLKTLLQPPPAIERLPGDSDVRQAWAVQITQSYFDFIQQSQRDQVATDAKRPNYPDPNCG